MESPWKSLRVCMGIFHQKVSSHSKMLLILEGGVIDLYYCGKVKFIMINSIQKKITINKGEKILTYMLKNSHYKQWNSSSNYNPLTAKNVDLASHIIYQIQLLSLRNTIQLLSPQIIHQLHLHNHHKKKHLVIIHFHNWIWFHPRNLQNHQKTIFHHPSQ